MPIPTEALRGLVDAAVRAPSSHNTQPWQFAVGDGTIELWADRTRRLPINDPADRELTISCGAALFNLRVAAAHAGLAAAVTLLPDRAVPDLLATVRLASGHGGGEALASLHPGVWARRTHRDALVGGGDVAGRLAAVAAAAAAEAAELIVIDGVMRERVIDLVASGDRIQFADRAWRRELSSWMRPRRRGDGLVMPSASLGVTRLVVGRFDVGRSTARGDRRLAAAAPALVVLATANDHRVDWLAAGQALQRVLLTATGAGWQAGYLNQPCQVGELRPELQALLPGRPYPQIVLRLGRPARQHRPAPRRPLSAVARNRAGRPPGALVPPSVNQ